MLGLLRAIDPGRRIAAHRGTIPAAPPDAGAGVRSAVRGSLGVLDRPDRGLWAIADGMPGQAAGDVAAATVIDALDSLADAATPGPAAVRAVLGRVDQALRVARLDPRGGAGASVVALHVAHGVATILWAGDCRAYRSRDGALALLTRDHSAVHELIDAGALAPSRAAAHPHVVIRAVGAASDLEIETVAVPLAAGDRLLLCAHGLPAALPAAMIAGRLRAPPASAADALIEAAACAGGGAVPLAIVAIG